MGFYIIFPYSFMATNLILGFLVYANLIWASKKK